MNSELIRLDSIFLRRDALHHLAPLLLLEHTKWPAFGRRVKPGSKAEVRRMTATKFPVHLFTYEQTMPMHN